MFHLGKFLEVMLCGCGPGDAFLDMIPSSKAMMENGWVELHQD